MALVVRRAEPSDNRFCQALVIATRSGGAAPRVIPLDAQPIRQPYALRGSLTPNGLLSANPPRWSSDNKTIAILANDNGITQVLGVREKDGLERFLTKAPGGVIDFAWVPGHQALIYSTRMGIADFEKAEDREALSGYHYDERTTPLMSPRPLPSAALPITYRLVSLTTGSDRIADPAEIALLVPRAVIGPPPDALATVAWGGASSAWLAPIEPSNWLSLIKIEAQVGDRNVRCDDPVCSGHLSNLWAVGGAFVYFRREGWGSSLTAIYRWRPGSPPERLFKTEDLLVGCDIDAGTLLCGREGSLQPRRLWSLDLASGREAIVFDPNPDFGRHTLPRVERLHWAGPLDAEGYGDLVIPSSAPPNGGYPAIVVQYRTRGFKRGAIGDEYPIFALAAHGFAVLSLENAPEYASLIRDPSIKTLAQAEAADTADDHERRLQLGNLEQFIQTAQSHIPLNMKRLGITGVSDAASSAIYALINTQLFAAASLGSPGLDPAIFAVGGPALRADFIASGYPMSGPAASIFYRSNTLLENAAKLEVPMLLQYPEDEYLGGLAAISALQDAKAPIDAYVFSGEPHVKWQPAHRLALYRHNIAWFDFWLRDRVDLNDSDPRELAHWRELRDHLCDRGPDGAPTQLCNQASTSTNSVTRR